ncbi:MAG: proteasome assembly chaperone family protein [Thermoplasmatota archaeon]
MMDVRVRPIRPCALEGGTLLVSVPQFGLASSVLTDHVLDRHAMDHIAGLDADEFPPLALVRKGRARYPLRIHADAASRLAVLRSEFPPPPILARPIARALLGWAKEHEIARIIALDHVTSLREPGMGEAPGPAAALGFVATTAAGRAVAEAAGIAELDETILIGLTAPLLLEARFAEADVLGIFAEMNSAFEEGRAVGLFAEALPRIVSGLRLDVEQLRAASQEIERSMRAMRAEAERAVAEMEPRPTTDAAPIYG